ncbi:MAG: hypothetical protein QOF16_454, partial [Actinomycetota bacterium]|nr:hypothetical protein [Actinomycetota bacterium]
SEVPTYKYSELVDAKIGTLPPQFTAAPTISPAVKQLLDSWTATAATPFQKLSSIQTHLRSEFRYELNVDQGSSADALTNFLTKTRAGFCQQFAAAFAMLARALGYPARVDIGFLPGTESAAHTFTVRGTDAHAWPEVYFEKFGWVAFEPTPRAAAPALAYTTEPGAQTPPPGTSRNGTLGGGAGGKAGSGGRLKCKHQADLGPASRLCAERQNERVNKNLTGVGTKSPQGLPAWRTAFAHLVRVLAVVLLIALMAIPAIKRIRRARRMRRAHTPRGAITSSFVDVEEAGAELLVARGRAEPATSYADRLSQDGHARRDDALELATLYHRALFRAAEPDQADVARARELATAITASLWAYASWKARFRRLFSPRLLLVRWARRPVLRTATA